jgi:hypothetical protein
VDPLGGLTQNISLVKGIEMSSWGESVDDTNFFERVWNRGLAVTERAWSDASLTDSWAAQPRLASFRCKMVRRPFGYRGIGAGPSEPDYCERPQYDTFTEAPAQPLECPEVDEHSWWRIIYALTATALFLFLLNIVQFAFWKRHNDKQYIQLTTAAVPSAMDDTDQ